MIFVCISLHSACTHNILLCSVDKLGNDENDRLSVTSDLESLLTFYCKSRGVTYKSDNGWIDILQPMLALKLSRSDLYNCFYALQQQLIPR